MKFTLIGVLLLSGLLAQANEKFKIRITTSNFGLAKINKEGFAFTKFSIPEVESEKTVGAPELPVKSWLVRGTPEQIRVKLQSQNTQIFEDTKPYPVQEQDCRCETGKIKTFAINSALYEKDLEKVSISYLGAYRGTPVSRVDVRLGSYDAKKNEVHIITSADVIINTPVFVIPRVNDFKDYLIVAPTNLVDGVAEFAEWKRSQGYNVVIETIAAPANDQAALQALIKNYYTEKGTDFVILVGNETALPMFKVSTSGSSQTPSDLKYFTMDGDADYIPDMLTSRIAASTSEQVASQLGKAIEFEKRNFENAAGLRRFIGIASNEGSNPSDNDYIKSIEEKYQQIDGYEIQHLFQNDRVNSNPAGLNAGLNKGAAWLTYLGHGSGTSWPSMAQSYSTTHIRQITNKAVVKPIIIDIACQNGRLIDGNLGTAFMRTEGDGFGAAAYYGGSVNISWHPPAVMARGIAFEHLTKRFHHLGEALLAGQLYLAANWNKQSDVIDNFEWFHLQGDPGMNINF